MISLVALGSPAHGSSVFISDIEHCATLLAAGTNPVERLVEGYFELRERLLHRVWTNEDSLRVVQTGLPFEIDERGPSERRTLSTTLALLRDHASKAGILEPVTEIILARMKEKVASIPAITAQRDAVRDKRSQTEGVRKQPLELEITNADVVDTNVNGKILVRGKKASGLYDELSLLDPVSRTTIRVNEVPTSDPLRAIVLTPEKDLLLGLLATKNQELAVWDTKTAKRIATYRFGEGCVVSLTPKYVVVSSFEKGSKVLPVDALRKPPSKTVGVRKVQQLLTSYSKRLDLGGLPSGRPGTITASESELILFDRRHEALIKHDTATQGKNVVQLEMKEDADPIGDRFSYSDDGKLIATGDLIGGPLRVFETATGKALFETPINPTNTRSVTVKFSSDNRFVIWGWVDHVFVKNLTDSSPALQIPWAHMVDEVGMLPDGTFVQIAKNGKELRTWDLSELGSEP